jgi:hypothetical protein
MNMPAPATLGKVIAVLTLISQGKTPTAACAEVGVSWSTVLKHASATPEMKDMLVNARQSGFDTLADILLEIDTHAMGSSDPKIMKVLSDNIKWYLAKHAPQKYGEKVTVEHNITADRAVVDALSRGKQRALHGKVIDAVVHEVVEEVVHIPAPEMPMPVALDVTGIDDDLLDLV